MEKTCKFCGAKFDAKTTWQKYCSEAHRIADFQQRQKQQQQPGPGKAQAKPQG